MALRKSYQVDAQRTGGCWDPKRTAVAQAGKQQKSADEPLRP